MPISSNLRSIVAMVVAVGFFSFMDGVMKALGTSHPPMQVAALRGLSALPLVCAYVVARGQTAALLQIRWRLHLLRGVMSVAMLSLFAYALHALPLTETQQPSDGLCGRGSAALQAGWKKILALFA